MSSRRITDDHHHVCSVHRCDREKSQPLVPARSFPRGKAGPAPFLDVRDSRACARTLKGFTRPVTRIVNLLVEEGVVPADAVAVLESSYQDGVKADGFSVPSALIDLL